MKKFSYFFFMMLITGINSIKSQDTISAVENTIDIIAIDEEMLPEDEPVFVMAEENARFQDGDLAKFREWVQKNLIYPEIALENCIKGRTYIQFNVTSNGNVVDAKILRGVDPSLDNEAVRVVMSSPAWEPVIANESSAPCLIHLIPH